MLVNAAAVETGTTLHCDLCIIGAGAAGITIARTFNGSRTNVCVLEGGALESDAASAALYSSIKNIGRSYPYLLGSRLRYFGGTSNHWGGHCVPLRPINFERGAWSAYSGWPISYDDVLPFYRRAETVLGLDGTDARPETVATLLEQKLFPFDDRRVQTQVSRYNRVRFGQVFRDELATSKNITAVLGANVTSIVSRADGESIEKVSVRTIGGRVFSVSAKHFVLATGGIENPRLLLASNAVHRGGLGNQYDLVGRFFMEHISYHKGIILPGPPYNISPFYTSELPAGSIGYRAHLVLPEQVVREAGIPDFRTELRALQYTVNEGVRSAKAVRDSFQHFKWPDHMAAHVSNIIVNADDVLAAARSTMPEPPHAYLMLNNVEQTPNPASRIALTIERDVLGMPIASIDWRLSAIDKQGIRFGHARIAEEVGRAGFGRVFDDMPEDEAELLTGADGACHHIGTTRMSNDPHQGVVDKNCCIHGVRNLFVAGSSVFPTGGYANPTFTIVALALRLAEYLHGKLHG
jgi:choline dehydrogenase-like flavoprotein